MFFSIITDKETETKSWQVKFENRWPHSCMGLKLRLKNQFEDVSM